MTKDKVSSWKDCRDSRTVEHVVKSHGGTVREAAGSHKVATVGNSSMTFYESRDISTGVAVKIFKWLRNVGIVGILILGYLLSRNSCNEHNYTYVSTSPDGISVYICE